MIPGSRWRRGAPGKDKEHRLRARDTGSRREATLPGAVRSQEEPTHRVQGPQGPGG
ncbi:Hypothetical protein RADP37_04218 [Roseomonas mucosa]|uniref:Uncharacterized protein n=1 Tax=Roseomonas mucosa TaxID=207340 RepID=A0A4Y1MW23_9PROT|nr:Hypothetical protein RADP37_04218 [Roseomonas mucosa]